MSRISTHFFILIRVSICILFKLYTSHRRISRDNYRFILPIWGFIGILPSILFSDYLCFFFKSLIDTSDTVFRSDIVFLSYCTLIHSKWFATSTVLDYRNNRATVVFRYILVRMVFSHRIDLFYIESDSTILSGRSHILPDCTSWYTVLRTELIVTMTLESICLHRVKIDFNERSEIFYFWVSSREHSFSKIAIDKSSIVG